MNLLEINEALVECNNSFGDDDKIKTIKYLIEELEYPESVKSVYEYARKTWDYEKISSL